jgi:hypothetical protein
MRYDEALEYLRNGGDFPRLFEAIGTLMSCPETKLHDFLLGLRHPGIIKEQAAFALYRRTQRPLPQNPAELVTDPQEWAEWLQSPAAQR